MPSMRRFGPAEVLDLARTLARAPKGEVRPGSTAHAALAALYGALDVVLGIEEISQH